MKLTVLLLCRRLFVCLLCFSANRTRAGKLERLLKEAIPGVKVEINKEKPRKGTFEVRMHGEPVVTFGPGMPRYVSPSPSLSPHPPPPKKGSFILLFIYF